VAIVFVEQASTPHPGAVRQARGRSPACTAAQSTYIPLKVNQAGVDPDHLRQSSAARTSRSCCGRTPPLMVGGQSLAGVDLLRTWCTAELRRSHMIVFAPARHRASPTSTRRSPSIPSSQADQHAAAGRVHPRHPSGPQTERYLARSSTRITLPGALFIAAVALIPSFILTTLSAGHQRCSSPGISILISVGVALETMKQIDGQLMQRNYEGFLK